MTPPIKFQNKSNQSIQIQSYGTGVKIKIGEGPSVALTLVETQIIADYLQQNIGQQR